MAQDKTVDNLTVQGSVAGDFSLPFEIDSVSDTDYSTNVSKTLQTNREANLYLVRGRYASGGGLPELEVTIDGITTANYNYTFIDTGTISYTSGDTSWKIVGSDSGGRTVGFELLLYLGDNFGGSATPVISGDIAGKTGIQKGEIFVNNLPADTIEFSTGAGAVLKATLYGLEGV